MIDHARDLASVRDATERLLTAAAEAGQRVGGRAVTAPGWSRGHVLAHLARNADALVNVLEGRPMYAYATTRDADIERDARAPWTPSWRTCARARPVPGDRSRSRGLVPHGGAAQRGRRLAARVPFRRWVEVELHNVDSASDTSSRICRRSSPTREIGFLAERFGGHKDVPSTALDAGTAGVAHGRGGRGPEVAVPGPAADLLGWLADAATAPA